ncbi:MAG: aldehyde dehydrogenase family protein [Bacteroidetes Order II. Incertae sedis bacterium]|nr:aldehyde dehydrogenase family protein [Bacteroidetes Order II. bacterium]
MVSPFNLLPTMNIQDILRTLQLSGQNPCVLTGRNVYSAESGPYKTIFSPIDGTELGAVQMADDAGYERAIQAAQAAFDVWRKVPAPKRGEIVRQIGDALRTKKEALGALVTLEMGKIYQEGLGEVQEMIDICDFAVGLSRQLYGLTMHSERPDHRMYEQWHPLGTVGIISAFNFPVAVWSWNAMIAAVCGNVSIWKPSEKTPLTAIACMNIIHDVLKENDLPEGVFSVVVGDAQIGQKMASDVRIPLVSATGSTRMGKAVAETVARRLGRSLLELGGNNAIIISEHADLNLAIPATLFGAVGTCGQRCTSTRRLIVQDSVYEEVRQKLLNAYHSLRGRIGNPLETETLIGPLIDQMAVSLMQKTLHEVQAEGGTVLFGGEALEGNYVVPALVEVENHYPSVQHETFAPILYLIRYKTIEEALAIQNGVPQGLSSAIFTNHLRESEYFLSAQGSDCGIANVNIGTSGAEIGGAFGGEKETGGGRESGSDAWKAYMRRQTNTINYSTALPLAQGIKFDL